MDGKGERYISLLKARIGDVEISEALNDEEMVYAWKRIAQQGCITRGRLQHFINIFIGSPEGGGCSLSALEIADLYKYMNGGNEDGGDVTQKGFKDFLTSQPTKEMLGDVIPGRPSRLSAFSAAGKLPFSGDEDQKWNKAFYEGSNDLHEENKRKFLASEEAGMKEIERQCLIELFTNLDTKRRGCLDADDIANKIVRNHVGFTRKEGKKADRSIESLALSQDILFELRYRAAMKGLIRRSARDRWGTIRERFMRASVHDDAAKREETFITDLGRRKLSIEGYDDDATNGDSSVLPFQVWLAAVGGGLARKKDDEL
ncbi:hypothetical protein FOL47_009882 [Perkinsus chesapeaki]|uniref:Uncharacterized protein n=1 Tax=Perkinsus chesapeaki TaxID=330153 RepID=A0A7J6MQX0_PERCH|nr:hypothetical protein FOL47_009882 [Perkinsus chesapeaki]